MIYFFDNELNMVKVATSKNVISAVHEHELNGLILGTVETDLSYTEAFINDVDYFGYYYKDNYYLHKIKRVEHEHENELVRITGRHIFFEDMLYGDYIRDVRPVNRDALYILNQTISANTRWQTVMTDTSKLHSETYYWVPPMEVLNDLTENVGIEYEPKILFDGQNINGFQLHVANRIGEDTPIRVPFGSRVLNLKYEVDYSEIVTALYGHGKGEEVGDGYGRRINFRDIDFSRNGVVSRPGSLFMENPNVTAQYGKDDGSPKFGRIIFEDIESTSELANATYEAYLEQSRPKMLFEASVVDLGDVGMGDGVLIIRREYDVYFNARIHKLMVDLLDAENADVELGDYAHFKESKVQRKTRENNNQYRRETSSRIQQLKEQFNDRFDGEVNQMREDFEQALIDAHAEIQAAEVRMEALIATTRNDWTDTFDAEVAEIYRKADEDYNRIETEITGVIDSTRDEMETSFNSKVNDARTYAEQQAQEKATAVRTDLETVTSGHQSMLEDLESNVLNIDDFLGSARDITLDERLQQINMNFIDRIDNINLNTRNILRGTSFDEPELLTLYNDAYIRQSDDPRSIRMGPSTGFNTTSFMLRDSIRLEADIDYYLVLEHRSLAVNELDYLQLQLEDGSFQPIFDADTELEGLNNLEYGTLDWHKKTIRINSSITLEGRLRIGTRFNQGDTTRGWIDVRQMYLTNTSNREWLPHPRDANQSIEEVTRRITELEDGREELITRTEYDFETGQINQTVRDIEETVDTSRSLIQDIQDLDIIQRGSEAIQTVDGFLDKVWLNDFSEIGANLIPQSANAWEDGTFWVGAGTPSENETRIRTKNFIDVIEGEAYTFRDESSYLSRINDIRIFEYEDDIYTGSYYIISRGTSRTFTTAGNQIKIALHPLDGFNVQTRFINHIDERIKMKLEKGDSATPFMNALSRVEQLADSYSVQVAELDGTYLKQSELEITPDYAQIGSMRIDGDTVGSLLRVSPSGIDAVAGAMRLSGDLLVDGDVEAITGDFIEGNFARLWAAEFKAIAIDVNDIYGVTAHFEYLYTLNANIEKLVAQNVFADGVTALVGNFVDVNAGNIVTSGLSANVIKTSHLDADTTMVRKLFATSARIDQLITRNHYVDNVKTLSIDAVYADLRSVNSEIMTSNIIKSNWLDVDTALFNRFTASSAFISNLTSKSAFIRDIQAIEITANQLNLTTLRNRFNKIEGGLHIRRTDHYVSNGVEYGMYIENGIPNMDVDVQRNQFMHNDVVGWTGQRYQMSGRNMSHNQMYNMETIYTSHKSKYITVGFGLNVSGTSGAYVVFELAEFSSGNSLGRRRVYVTSSGGTNWNSTTVNLGVPDYNSPKSFYLRAGLEEAWSSTYLQVIINRVNMHG